MEIVLRPSIIFPIVLTIFFLLVLLQVSKDWSQGKYIRNFSMIVVTIGFFVVFFLSIIQKTTIDINESGLSLKMTGHINIFLPWDDIKSVNYQKNYKDAGCKPTSPGAGSNFPGYNAGYYRLANKKLVYCVLTGFTADAIVIEAKKDFYILLSFKKLAEAFEEISKHTRREQLPAIKRRELMGKKNKKEINAYGIKVLLSPHPAIRHLKKQFKPNSHGNRFWWSSWLLMDYFERTGLEQGSRVLEIGCGWGLASIYCARKHKALVTGADIDRNVLPYAMLHAEINGVDVSFTRKGFESLRQKDLEGFDVLLGADICFWENMTRPLKNLIKRAQKAGVKEILISDPVRSPFEELCDYFSGRCEGEVLDWTASEPREILGRILRISG